MRMRMQSLLELVGLSINGDEVDVYAHRILSYLRAGGQLPGPPDTRTLSA